jgi:phthalate 4,5-dioxygenase
VRASHFVAPFWGLIPTRGGWLFQQGFVPVDDEHTMFYLVHYRAGAPLTDSESARIREWTGLTPLDSQYRVVGRSRDKDWGQDRAAMIEGTSFSGLFGYAAVEDLSVQESMGPIYDRTREHLGTSDMAVIRMRRAMLDQARQLTDANLALNGDFDYGMLKAQEAIIERSEQWTTVGEWRRPTTPAAASGTGQG